MHTDANIWFWGKSIFLLHVRCLCAKVNHYLQAQSVYKLKNRGNDCLAKNVNCVLVSVFEIPDSLADHVAHIDNHQLLRDGLVAVWVVLAKYFYIFGRFLLGILLTAVVLKKSLYNLYTIFPFFCFPYLRQGDTWWTVFVTTIFIIWGFTNSSWEKINKRHFCGQILGTQFFWDQIAMHCQFKGYF